MTLVTMPARDDPRVAGWLAVGDNCTAEGYDVITRAWCDLGICEQPEGSNWGGRIKTMANRMGYTTPQYWCAIWVCCVLADRGFPFPKWGADCDQWIRYAHLVTLKGILGASREAQKHFIGAQILYGVRGRGDHKRAAADLKRDGWNAYHIGIISRITSTRVYTIEGNRGYAGGVTNNGEWVDNEPVSRNDIIGVVPLAARDPEYVPKKQIVRLVAA